MSRKDALIQDPVYFHIAFTVRGRDHETIRGIWEHLSPYNQQRVSIVWLTIEDKDAPPQNVVRIRMIKLRNNYSMLYMFCHNPRIFKQGLNYFWSWKDIQIKLKSVWNPPASVHLCSTARYISAPNKSPCPGSQSSQKLRAPRFEFENILNGNGIVVFHATSLYSILDPHEFDMKSLNICETEEIFGLPFLTIDGLRSYLDKHRIMAASIDTVC